MRKYINNIVAFIGRKPANQETIAPNTERNQKNIEALIAAGSNPAKPHAIEHHFYCYSKDLLSGLTTKGSALGYRITKIGSNDYEGARNWYVNLVKDNTLDLKTIDEENSRLLRLAGEFKGSYNGWGTKVVL